VTPIDFVQIEKHFLFKFVLPVVHCNRVVIFAETMSDSYKGWLLNVANVRSSLARFNTHHDYLGINAAECIDHNFTLN
jgi:hypothetical protein